MTMGEKNELLKEFSTN